MIENDNSQTILERIASGDKMAVVECVDKYGDLIYTAVVNRTRSEGLTEDLILSIFKDVWKYSNRFDPTKQSEERFISLLVHRRLIKNNKHQQQPSY